MNALQCALGLVGLPLHESIHGKERGWDGTTDGRAGLQREDGRRYRQPGTIFPGDPFAIFSAVCVHAEEQCADDSKGENTHRVHEQRQHVLARSERMGSQNGARTTEVRQDHERPFFKELEKGRRDECPDQLAQETTGNDEGRPVHPPKNVFLTDLQNILRVEGCRRNATDQPNDDRDARNGRYNPGDILQENANFFPNVAVLFDRLNAFFRGKEGKPKQTRREDGEEDHGQPKPCDFITVTKSRYERFCSRTDDERPQ